MPCTAVPEPSIGDTSGGACRAATAGPRSAAATGLRNTAVIPSRFTTRANRAARLLARRPGLWIAQIRPLGSACRRAAASQQGGQAKAVLSECTGQLVGGVTEVPPLRQQLYSSGVVRPLGHAIHPAPLAHFPGLGRRGLEPRRVDGLAWKGRGGSRQAPHTTRSGRARASTTTPGLYGVTDSGFVCLPFRQPPYLSHDLRGCHRPPHGAGKQPGETSCPPSRDLQSPVARVELQCSEDTHVEGVTAGFTCLHGILLVLKV